MRCTRQPQNPALWSLWPRQGKAGTVWASSLRLQGDRTRRCRERVVRRTWGNVSASVEGSSPARQHTSLDRASSEPSVWRLASCNKRLARMVLERMKVGVGGKVRSQDHCTQTAPVDEPDSIAVRSLNSFRKMCAVIQHPLGKGAAARPRCIPQAVVAPSRH